MRRADIHRLIDEQEVYLDPTKIYTDWDAADYDHLALFQKTAAKLVTDFHEDQYFEVWQDLAKVAAVTVSWLENMEDDGEMGFSPRQPGETVEEFYHRVAEVFRGLRFTNTGRETTTLAEMAEVPFSTAVYWVRQARKRGYLGLSRRQISRRRAS